MHWEFWDGEKLGPEVAFDTETVFSKDIETKSPELVLASAYDGSRSYIVRREDLGDFLIANKTSHLVLHNAQFDFWVIDSWLRRLSGENKSQLHPGLQVLWDLVDQDRLHDTLLLDQLVRLAQGLGQKGGITPRGLQALSEELCPPEYQANKDLGGEDPYRHRYHELLESPLFVDPGFYDYAIQDVVATWHCYQALVQQAQEQMAKVPRIETRYGLLTESLQVKASIALRKITLNGIAVDKEAAARVEQEYRTEAQASWDWLMEHHPELFSYDPKGQLILTPKGRVPKLGTKVFKTVLQSLADGAGFEPPQSTGKQGGISTSEKAWAPYVQFPLIEHWGRTVRSKSILKFFDIFRTCESRVHPRYLVLKNTGRTGASGPAIQQTPRVQKFRDIYCAPSGKKLLTIDYSFIELRTLAAVCYTRFGFSVLGDVIKKGVDPHVYTAALINGLSVEEFLKLPKDRIKKDRQSAKAVNFSIPGGLGPPKLVSYAKTTYGVEMTEAQAQAFRTKLTTEIYPEIGRYLEDEPVQNLAYNLGLDPAYVETLLGHDSDKTAYLLSKVLKGEGRFKDGRKYSPSLMNEMWSLAQQLARASGREDLRDACAQQRGSPDLEREFLGHASVTLTGRIRAGCDYTSGRNHPFQALAADGAKAAMWVLTQRGYKVVIFCHDEFVLEIEDESQVPEIKAIVEGEMVKVLNGLVPVGTAYHVDRVWHK